MDWIFQAIPRRYDLRTEMKTGNKETWLVTRYKDKMKRGDIVFMWQAGPAEIRGVYGWGRIVGREPHYYERWGHGVDVQYEKVFPNHLSSDAVRALPAFADHVLFKMAIGTNFELTPDQKGALVRLIESTFGAGVAPDG